MDTEKIGRFIATRRKTRGLTQQQLADELGLTNKAISKWETGQGMPDITALPILAELLGVKVDELLKGELIEDKMERGIESSYEVDKSIFWFRVMTGLSIFFALMGNVTLLLMMKETSAVGAFLFGSWFEFCSLSVFLVFYLRMKGEVDRYNKNTILMINPLKFRNQFVRFELWLWLFAPSGLMISMIQKFFSWDNFVMLLVLTLAATLITRRS